VTRVWWKVLADIAFCAYHGARARERPYLGIDESGVFRIKEAA
jgi:hypothetical protein